MKHTKWTKQLTALGEQLRQRNWRADRDAALSRARAIHWTRQRVIAVAAAAAVLIGLFGLGLVERQQGPLPLAGQGQVPEDDQPSVGGRGGAFDPDGSGSTKSGADDDGYYAEPQPTETSPVDNCGGGSLSCFEEEVRYEIDRLNAAGYNVDEMGQTVCTFLDTRAGSALHELIDWDRAEGFGNTIGDVNVGILMRESAQHLCPKHIDYVEDEIARLVF